MKLNTTLKTLNVNCVLNTVINAITPHPALHVLNLISLTIKANAHYVQFTVVSGVSTQRYAQYALQGHTGTLPYRPINALNVPLDARIVISSDAENVIWVFSSRMEIATSVTHLVSDVLNPYSIVKLV